MIMIGMCIRGELRRRSGLGCVEKINERGVLQVSQLMKKRVVR